MTDEQIIAIADGLGFPSDDNEAITFARALLSASIADTALVSERCTRYAKELAVSLHRQHFAESAPQWKPLDDLYGLLSQIDNMSTELVRRADTAGAKPVGIPLLAEDHKGMLVDYSGMFKQARGALARGHKEPMLAEMLRQMQDHITELGKRWYAGDTAVVDELLQLYCVEKGARDALVATPPAPSVASTAKPVQVIPQGIMGIPPNPPGSVSTTIRHDILTRNGSTADTTGAKAAQPISDAMMDLVDRLGSEADAVDPRAWAHLLVYAHPHMTLDKPAQVSGARFGTGVKWSTVIGAAQRHYEFMQTPEKEAMRIENARAFIAGAKPVALEALRIADKFCDSLTSDACPDDVAIPIKDALRQLTATAGMEKDAERLDWIARQGDEFGSSIIVDAPGDGCYAVFGIDAAYGWGITFREAIDAAMKEPKQ